MRFGTFLLLFFSTTAFGLPSPTPTEATPPEPVRSSGSSVGYRKQEILDARFGVGQREELLKKVYRFRPHAEKILYHQERVLKATEQKLVQFVEGYGSRTVEPVNLNVIGLTGSGKGLLIQAIEALGIPVTRFDAQKYVNLRQARPSDIDNLEREFQNAAYKPGPRILLFDEIDKLPEITPEGEFTHPFIAELNSILAEGKIHLSNGSEAQVSNVMVITTMNFSPIIFELFAKEVLKEEKNYYDFTLDDFAKFDRWLSETPAARYKALSHSFRSNTVSRLAPNAVFTNPLDEKSYLQLIHRDVARAIERVTLGKDSQSRARRIAVEVDPSYEEFLLKNAVFAPSGARETVSRTDVLTEQLIHFGERADNGDPQSLARPRRIGISAHPNENQVVLTITPQVQNGKKLVDTQPFLVQVAYDPSSLLFIQPEHVALIAPQLPKVFGSETARPMTKKALLKKRFPENPAATPGLANYLDGIIFDEEETTRLLENDLNIYQGRPGPALKRPDYRVIAGFPGIGKSDLIDLAAKERGLPVVRVNLQHYTSDSIDSVKSLSTEMHNSLPTARQRKGGKFILKLEELDKIPELRNGEVQDRPIMGAIKDALSEGVLAGHDIRDAYVVITMNFAVDLFGFQADPRLTSIEDMMRAYRRLSANPVALQQTLKGMFLPETIDRILPRFHIMKPGSKLAYEKIIASQAEKVLSERFGEMDSDKNSVRIQLKLSPSYRRYLFSETVIPSQGPRHTEVSSRDKIAGDLEMGLAALKKSSPLAAVPLIILLDYKPKSSTVVATALPADPEDTTPKEVLYRRPVALQFPSLRQSGRLDINRLEFATHEFGHAFVRVRLGQRIQNVIVGDISPGAGGMVRSKHTTEQTAEQLFSRLYTALGSRAMERLLRSENPTQVDAVMDNTLGTASDITQATRTLWQLVYKFGLDPYGVTVERSGSDEGSTYAPFQGLPHDRVEAFGKVLRDLEDFIVRDFQQAHSLDWYREKIPVLARAGEMTEEEFYRLIEYPYPGDNSVSYGSFSPLQSAFGDIARKIPSQVLRAAEFKQGNTQTTAPENMRKYISVLKDSLKLRLHADLCDGANTHGKNHPPIH